MDKIFLSYGINLTLKQKERFEKYYELLVYYNSKFNITAITEKEEVISKSNILVNLAGPANKQGHIAADNICGIDNIYSGVNRTSIIKLFDMTVASTGINEKEAKRLNLKYEKIILVNHIMNNFYLLNLQDIFL